MDSKNFLMRMIYTFSIVTLFLLFSCGNPATSEPQLSKSKVDSDKLNQSQIDSLSFGDMISRDCFKSIAGKYKFIQSAFISNEDVLSDSENYNINFLYDSINNVLIANTQVTFGYEQKAYLFKLTNKQLVEINGNILKCFLHEKNVLLERDFNGGIGREFRYSINDYTGKELLKLGSSTE
jgi:hypothetical protein